MADEEEVKQEGATGSEEQTSGEANSTEQTAQEEVKEGEEASQ